MDINPNSVKICRLRLWIELLKNAYYKTENVTSSGVEKLSKELETLPNIDINIKCGNSLISRFALDADLSKALKSIKYDINQYKGFVHDYKNAHDKELKRGLEQIINSIKNDFRVEISNNSKEFKDFNKWKGELINLTMQTDLFEKTPKEKKEFDLEVKKLTEKISKQEALIEDIKSNAIYRNAFEWRFEFPEVLDKEGNFEGFDLIVGNPPYIAGKDLYTDIKDYLRNNYKLLSGKFDLYLSFIEKGIDILNKAKIMSFIIPNTILANENAIELRKHLVQNKLLKEIVVLNKMVFEEASVESVIINLNHLHSNESIKLLDETFIPFKEISAIELASTNDSRIQISSNSKDDSIIHKINSKSILLGSILDLCIGIQIGGEGDSKDFKAKYISDEKISSEYKKIIDGKNFEPFSIKWSNKYLKYGDWLHRKRDEKYFLNPKIVFRQIGATPVATVDYENYYVLNTIYAGILTNADFNLNYVFALINSKLIKYVWLKQFHDGKGLFPKIKKTQLVEVPIFKSDKKTQELISNLVFDIIELKKNNKDTVEKEKQIDKIIYELYDLTEEEIKIVEGK